MPLKTRTRREIGMSKQWQCLSHYTTNHTKRCHTCSSSLCCRSILSNIDNMWALLASSRMRRNENKRHFLSCKGHYNSCMLENGSTRTKAPDEPPHAQPTKIPWGAYQRQTLPPFKLFMRVSDSPGRTPAYFGNSHPLSLVLFRENKTRS